MVTTKNHIYVKAKDVALDSSHYSTSYLQFGISPDRLLDTAERAAFVLNQYQYDALAFRGMSGALITPLLSVIVGKPFVMVRKPDETRHTNDLVEGLRDFKKYIIVDDLISSGNTVRAIQKAIWDWCPTATCLGTLTVGNLPSLAKMRSKCSQGNPYPLADWGLEVRQIPKPPAPKENPIDLAALRTALDNRNKIYFSWDYGTKWPEFRGPKLS